MIFYLSSKTITVDNCNYAHKRMYCKKCLSINFTFQAMHIYLPYTNDLLLKTLFSAQSRFVQFFLSKLETNFSFSHIIEMLRFCKSRLLEHHI